ncbi:MAG: serine/threonine protein kinase [Ardenticatenaceae bacterium]|nr:serine/threonine protein kinase [Ardenticatenaceae bacterium]MCB8987040.1 serine/threonine protein kinase [Ardenticatenaceae bacterium]
MQGELRTLNGRYRLLGRIGSGGMAAVYRAQDLKLGRIVAIKMLHESLTSDEGFLIRFQREAHAAANLTHPNIVTVHDIGQEEYRHYIVMEYVDGFTLKQIIRDANEDGRFLPVSRVLDLTIQICNGIGYAHRANLVHCDLKPQNVLVTRDDRVKVADFGIARAITEASQHLADSQVWGTPQYISPEQAAGQTPTPASDVYAIGVIMFEMLTGHLPFAADSPTAMALKHLQEVPPSILEYNPGVPRQLDDIVHKLLAKEPSARYSTAGQLGRILSAYRDRSLADTGPVYPALVKSQTTAKTAVPTSEQETHFYQRPQVAATDAQDTPRRPMRPVRPPSPLPQAASQPTPAGPDWTIIGLGITAVISLLGLIPLWYLVYRAWAG